MVTTADYEFRPREVTRLPEEYMPTAHWGLYPPVKEGERYRLRIFGPEQWSRDCFRISGSLLYVRKGGSGSIQAYGIETIEQSGAVAHESYRRIGLDSFPCSVDDGTETLAPISSSVVVRLWRAYLLLSHSKRLKSRPRKQLMGDGALGAHFTVDDPLDRYLHAEVALGDPHTATSLKKRRLFRAIGDEEWICRELFGRNGIPSKVIDLLPRSFPFDSERKDVYPGSRAIVRFSLDDAID